MNVSLTSSNTFSSPLHPPEGIKQALVILEKGISEIFKKNPMESVSPDTFSKLKDCLAFIRQLQIRQEKIPFQRLWEMTHSLLRQCNRLIRKNWETEITFPNDSTASSQPTALPFLSQATFALGPEINVSSDRMTLTVLISQDLAPRWTEKLLREWIKKCGILQGIEDSSLKKLFDHSDFGQMVRVARGKEPIAGEDAAIEDCLHFPTSQRTTQMPGDSNVTTDVPRLFMTIKTGQILLKKHSATLGEPGIDLYGQAVPSTSGLDLTLPAIDHCELNHNGTELRSSVNGFAFKENRKLTVFPALLIDSQVNPVTGDQDTQESLVIAGDITTGSRVNSGGTVALEGSIRGAKVKARDSVLCQAGIVGEEKAEVQAGKDVKTIHIHDAAVSAGNAIEIIGPVTKSFLSARRIGCKGEHGKILGGKLQAWEDICAQTIGSELGIETELCLGDELAKLREEMTQLEERILEKRNQREKYESIRKSIVDKTPSTAALPAQVQTKLDQIAQLLNVLEGEIKAVQQKLDSVVQDFQYSKKSVRMVRAREAIYEGTVIRICGKTLIIKETLGPSTVLQEDESIFTIPYQERTWEEENDN